MKESAYKKSGVDIDAGDALVGRIGGAVKTTRRKGVMGGLGGFGALFDLKATGFRDPLLVSATDGVGTKLRVAIDSGLYDTVGIDLVAMCVNDLVTSGAEPLFFLDYYATGRLNVDEAEMVIGGIAAGCREAGCALIGGETAEMPGMYAAGDYDLAGFAVGAVERERLVTGADVADGDVVLGLRSSGIHSNGFSLVRRVMETTGLDYGKPAPFDPDQRLGQALLAPTRIYVKPLLGVLGLDGAAGRPLVKALAHITGGGLLENIPRVVPEHLSIRLDAAAWPLPPVFSWLAGQGGLDADDLARTFNCGIGMVLVCAAGDADVLTRALAAQGERAFPIGSITADGPAGAVKIDNRERAWTGVA